jgi:hypothetical protein
LVDDEDDKDDEDTVSVQPTQQAVSQSIVVGDSVMGSEGAHLKRSRTDNSCRKRPRFERKSKPVSNFEKEAAQLEKDMEEALKQLTNIDSWDEKAL